MIDANDIEKMANERPDECFLKGSGVLKLTGAIRQLEKQNAELLAALKQARTHIVDWWRPDGELSPARSHVLVEDLDDLISRCDSAAIQPSTQEVSK